MLDVPTQPENVGCSNPTLKCWMFQPENIPKLWNLKKLRLLFERTLRLFAVSFTQLNSFKFYFLQFLSRLQPPKDIK